MDLVLAGAGGNLMGKRMVHGNRREADRGGHHITSISAWIAPVALIACRIEIKSRGPTPSAFSPSTRSESDTPSCTTPSLVPSSCTPILVRGTTLVRPRENGPG